MRKKKAKAKNPFTNPKGLNLILKKDMPSTDIDNKEIKRPKGFVCLWDEDSNSWFVVHDVEIDRVCIEDYENNKDWYGLTKELPARIMLGNKEVLIKKEGIDVGCQFVPKNVVLEIAKRLKAIK